MVYYPKPAANEKYAQFYLKCAEQCAETGDYENTCIFLDLAEDFMPEAKTRIDRTLRDNIHVPLQYDALKKSLYFMRDRAHDLMLNKEKDRTLGVGIEPAPTEFDKDDQINWAPIRIQAAKDLLGYVCENSMKIYNSMPSMDTACNLSLITYHIKNIETLIEQYH